MVKLEYNFKAGDKLNYQMDIDGEMTVQVKAEKGNALPAKKAKIKGQFNYTHEVKAVNPKDKIAQIHVTYGKSYMNTIIGNQVVPNPDVSELAGKTAVVMVNKSGEVKGYEAPKELPLSLQNVDYRKMFAEFPGNELRIGESWIRDSESSEEKNENFSMHYVTYSKYTLLGIEERDGYKCAKVRLEVSTNSYTKSKKSALPLNGQVQGEVEGVIYYDLIKGYVVYSDLHTKINNEVVTLGESEEKDKEKKDDKEGPAKITTILITHLHTVTKLL